MPVDVNYRLLGYRQVACQRTVNASEHRKIITGSNPVIPANQYCFFDIDYMSREIKEYLYSCMFDHIFPSIFYIP